MSPEEFVDLVRRMRAKQVEYFRTRRAQALSEAKDLERRVDAELEGPKAETPPRLFDE